MDLQELEIQEALDPALFAQVWERIGSERSAVEPEALRPVPLPQTDMMEPKTEALEETCGCEAFLKRMCEWEVCHAGGFCRLRRWNSECEELKKAACARARQLNTELFLRTGEKMSKNICPQPFLEGRPLWLLRNLWQESRRMEQAYRSEAEQEKEKELSLFYARLACELSIEQSRIRNLIENCE